MKNYNSGFTLIELLVVMVIIGILATIFFWNMAGSLRNYELREATSQLAADFRNARSVAQKGSSDTTIAWPSANFSRYTITQGAKVTSSNIANGITVACTIGCGSATSFVYTAPYGELKSSTGATFTGAVFTVSSPAAGITPMEVRVVGVTGKVIIARQGS